MPSPHGWLSARWPSASRPRTLTPSDPTPSGALKDAYPELRLCAWLGQVEVAGGGPLDLSSNEARAGIVATARSFLELGFDGAVMTYDTALPIPWLYGWLVSWTVRWRARQGLDDVLVGVPTYDDLTPGHLPCVENLPNSVRGLRCGLAGLEPGDRAKVGAAVYAEWTTLPQEKASVSTRRLASLRPARVPWRAHKCDRRR